MIICVKIIKAFLLSKTYDNKSCFLFDNSFINFFSLCRFTINQKIYFPRKINQLSSMIARDWIYLTIANLFPKRMNLQRIYLLQIYETHFQEEMLQNYNSKEVICLLTFTTHMNIFIMYILLLFFPSSLRPFTWLSDGLDWRTINWHALLFLAYPMNIQSTILDLILTLWK